MPRTDDTVRFKNDTSVLSVCYACIIISEITLQLFFLYISESLQNEQMLLQMEFTQKGCNEFVKLY